MPGIEQEITLALPDGYKQGLSVSLSLSLPLSLSVCVYECMYVYGIFRPVYL